jgi:hypothetical protein
LSLSLLSNNTYLHYAESLEDVAVISWKEEFSVDLGEPLGPYYERSNALWRDFESGTVVCAPDSSTTADFERNMTDIETGIEATTFAIGVGEGGIFVK